jgi:hypothetical protein
LSKLSKRKRALWSFVGELKGAGWPAGQGEIERIYIVIKIPRL